MADNPEALDKISISKLQAGRRTGFFTLVYMLVLALLAWGVDDFAGFLVHPVRIGLIVVALTHALFHGRIARYLPIRPNREQQHDPEHWHYSLAELISILAAFGDRRNILTWAENPSLRWVGLGIFLLGSIYATWANLTWINHLLHEAERAYDSSVLLSKGPFRWTRYPSLLSLFFCSLGFTLAFRSWMGLALIVPLIYIIIRRINQWEKIYAECYGRDWALRCQASKRIIPFLY
jgi:protein-S-isoprenylcysteine O-methyltransferase Ste14